MKFEVIDNFEALVINLAGRDFCGINLSFSNLDESDLSHVCFSTANLEKCNMRGSNLESVNFSSANLKAANFESANLISADLTNAEVGGANLKNAVFNDNTRLPFDYDEAISRGMVYESGNVFWLHSANLSGRHASSVSEDLPTGDAIAN